MSRAMTKSITLNGAPHRTTAETIADLARELELAPEKVAVERNGEIVPRSTLAEALLADGDRLEIVHFVGGGDHAADDSWTVGANRSVTVGEGKGLARITVTAPVLSAARQVEAMLALSAEQTPFMAAIGRMPPVLASSSARLIWRASGWRWCMVNLPVCKALLGRARAGTVPGL